MSTCNDCQHIEDVHGGRIVSARCLATGITFPARGVSCKSLGNVERRAEISPDTFACKLYAPRVTIPCPPQRNGVRVVNGEVV